MLNPSIGIFTTDQDLRITSWDYWMAQATGITAAAARGRTLLDIQPDLEERGIIKRLQNTLDHGVVEILSPALHHYLIVCRLPSSSKYFEWMQQHVTIAPLRKEEAIIGLLVTLENVTPRLEEERTFSEQLRNEDERVRLRAAERLSSDKLAPTDILVEALRDKSWRIRKVAVRGLAQYGGKTAIAALLKALQEEHHDPGVLNSALDVLSMIDIDVVAPLAEFLKGSDTDLRIYAALALGGQKDPRAVDALLSVLQDSEKNVQFQAIESLGRLRATAAAEPLATLAASGDFFLSFPALEALAAIGEPAVVPQLMPLLHDAMLRPAVAHLLGMLGDQEAVDALVALLSLPHAPEVAATLVKVHDRYERLYNEGAYISDRIRQKISEEGKERLLADLDGMSDDELKAAVCVLLWIKDPAINRQLSRFLNRPAVRREMMETLGEGGEGVTDLLVTHLKDADMDTRRAAITALGNIGSKTVVGELVALLNGESALILPVAGALAKIGDQRAFEPLLALLGHPDAGVRQAVIGALNSLGHPDLPKRAAALLGSENAFIRESAVRIVGYFGEPEAFEPFLVCCQDLHERVSRAAIEHLPFFDDSRAQKTLLKILREGQAPQRASAARALAQTSGPAVSEALLVALNDKDPWVQYYAIRSLAHHGVTEAIEPLSLLAQSQAPTQVRAASIEALGRLGGPRCVALLAPFVAGISKDLAKAAMKALGHVGHPDALIALLAGTRSPNFSERIEAAQAIGERRDGDSVKVLYELLQTEKDPQVIQAVIHALSESGTSEAVEALILLTLQPAHREMAIASLGHQPETFLPTIAAALKHPQALVRRAIVDVLRRMRQPAASQQLLVALRDTEPTIRLAAVNALRELGSQHSGSLLNELARTDNDASVRQAALVALSRRG